MRRNVWFAAWMFSILAFTTTGCKTATTQEYMDMRYILSIVIISLLLLVFAFLAIYTNMLRDEVSNCDEFEENLKKIKQKSNRKFVNSDNPFSLSKVQLGFWTVVIASSYIYLEFLKGDCSFIPVNKTALILMGIGAGTAAASTIIDKREMSDNRPRHQNTPTQGFFADILSDDNGISIHRFQHVVWTGIAIIVYMFKVANVEKGCILPELSDTLLTLTGISSATFLVLRSKENDPPVSAAVASSEHVQSLADSTINAEKQAPVSTT